MQSCVRLAMFALFGSVADAATLLTTPYSATSNDASEQAVSRQPSPLLLHQLKLVESRLLDFD